jgi:biopolymer transport protein ExbB/TolQ
VTAAYRDDSTKRVGLLLKNPPDQSFTPFDWKEQLPVDVAGDLDRALTAVSNESAPVVLIPVDVLLTQNLTKAYTQAKDKGFWRTIWETLETGGVFMLPLGAILITLIVMFTQKLRQLRRARKGHREQDAAAAKAEQGDARAVREIQGRNPENLSLRVVDAIAARREAGRAEAEKAAKEVLVREVPRLERGLTTLAVLAAAAPMLGLLGTISGLVAMFQVITEMGVNDPKMLAGGIGEALVSTEAGLLIAIPALLGHNYLANRVDDLIADAEYRATRTLNVLWPKG